MKSKANITYLRSDIVFCSDVISIKADRVEGDVGVRFVFPEND